MASLATVEPHPRSAEGNDIILRTTGLTKRFGRLEPVRDLNLELRRGEVLGFLGPNGAGKSTTVGMILGLVAPTEGSIELFGHELNGNQWAVLRRVDRDIRLIAAGISLWIGDIVERTQLLLEQASNLVDYISLHLYVGNSEIDFSNYMALSELFEKRLSAYEGLIRGIMS